MRGGKLCALKARECLDQMVIIDHDFHRRRKPWIMPGPENVGAAAMGVKTVVTFQSELSQRAGFGQRELCGGQNWGGITEAPLSRANDAAQSLPFMAVLISDLRKTAWETERTIR